VILREAILNNKIGKKSLNDYLKENLELINQTTF
jgi:hypothetical protein